MSNIILQNLAKKLNSVNEFSTAGKVIKVIELFAQKEHCCTTSNDT